MAGSKQVRPGRESARPEWRHQPVAFLLGRFDNKKRTRQIPDDRRHPDWGQLQESGHHDVPKTMAGPFACLRHAKTVARVLWERLQAANAEAE